MGGLGLLGRDHPFSMRRIFGSYPFIPLKYLLRVEQVKGLRAMDGIAI